MKFEKRQFLLREKAEQIVNFTPEELSQVSTEEIQRLFYDLQVYQVELEMQHDELKKAQHDLSVSHNRYHFLYHQVPVGILSLDHNGFIEDSNQFFCNMFNIKASELNKKHFSSLILEKDKTIFINRFNAFFKAPDGKSICLRMLGNLEEPVYVKLMAILDTGDDYSISPELNDQSQLILTVTNVQDIKLSPPN